MRDAVVIGAGLFGQVITAELQDKLGMDVLMVDARRPGSGSGPSASLMKPSWLQSVTTSAQDLAYAVLDRHYGVHDLSFKVGPMKVDTVRWCDPRKIMKPEALALRVFQIRPNGPGWVVEGMITESNYEIHLETLTVIVAAGVWSWQLVPVPGLTGKAGAAVVYRNAQIKQPFIRPWAPYKQVTAFNLGPDLWVGDSSAILEKNWTAERQQQTVDRCSAVVEQEDFYPDLPPEKEVLVGVRPYVPKKHFAAGHPCYLKEHKPGLWVATGGAKNGTIAAGWCAGYLANRMEL